MRPIPRACFKVTLLVVSVHGGHLSEQFQRHKWAMLIIFRGIFVFSLYPFLLAVNVYNMEKVRPRAPFFSSSFFFGRRVCMLKPVARLRLSSHRAFPVRPAPFGQNHFHAPSRSG